MCHYLQHTADRDGWGMVSKLEKRFRPGVSAGWGVSPKMEHLSGQGHPPPRRPQGGALVTPHSAPVPEAPGAVPAPEVWDGAQRVHGEEHPQQLPRHAQLHGALQPAARRGSPHSAQGRVSADAGRRRGPEHLRDWRGVRGRLSAFEVSPGWAGLEDSGRQGWE